jgi:hypothetical protein
MLDMWIRGVSHWSVTMLAAFAALLLSDLAVAEEPAKPPEAKDDTQALAKEAQNPIANLISVPFQNNSNFNYGPRERTQNILNFQPVVPFKLSDDWNLITRTIVPIVHQPSLAKGETSDNGLGDVNPTLFFATSIAKDLMVGFGPTFTLPTSTQDSLGARKWSAGPAAVFVWTPGKWVVGGLINNQWSYAGDSSERSVNAMLVQPFVNYNIADGWYLTSSPIITADWNARESKDTWTVPVGGGVGRLFRLDKLPINASIQAFDNIETPQYGADWTLRLQVQFLFPK